MKWEYVGVTLIFTVVGYLIGSLLFSVILSKIFHNTDVRDKGSGNAGATNVVRNFGIALGVGAFVLDVSKTVVSVLIAWVFKEFVGGFFSGVLLQAVAFAVVVGHSWPIWFKFKGGKGASTSFGFLLVTQWILGLIGIVIFFSVIRITKIVALGTIFGLVGLCFISLAFSLIPLAWAPFGAINDSWSVPIMHEPAYWINTLFLFIITSLIIIRHQGNIKRMLAGNESRTKKL